jgi:2-methylcitrate dehydratase PrpD
MLAQYSIPFRVALALHREARDPESETPLRDPQIRALCRHVRLVPAPDVERAGVASTVTTALADGRRFASRAENGMLEPGELEDKFLRLTRRAIGERSDARALRAAVASRRRGEPRLARRLAAALDGARHAG